MKHQHFEINFIFVAILIAATFLMGSSFIAGKILILAGFPALLLVACRFYMGAIFALPLLFLEKNSFLSALFPQNLSIKQKTAIFFIGLFQTGGAMGFLFLAMRTISAANGAILLFTNPLWVAILGRILLGEHLSYSRVFGLILGIFGVALAVGADSINDIKGHLIGLCAGFSWAAATTINKKANLPIGIWTLSFWQMFIGATIILIFALLQNQKLPQTFSAEEWAWFLWLAGPGSAASFSLWFIALKKGGVTTASSFLFMAPVFAIILSFFFLHTKLGLIELSGGALVCLGIYLINHSPPKNISQHQKLHEAEMMGEP